MRKLQFLSGVFLIVLLAAFSPFQTVSAQMPQATPPSTSTLPAGKVEIDPRGFEPVDKQALSVTASAIASIDTLADYLKRPEQQ